MFQECLNSIIGLSQSDCDCLPSSGDSIDPKESLSGYYMDNLEHGIPLEIKPDCGNGSIWDLMNRARCEEINDFITRLGMELHRFKEIKGEHFFSYMGYASKNGNSSRIGLKEFTGFVFRANEGYESLQMTVNSVHLGINVSGSYAIEVIDIDNFISLGFYNVDVDGTGKGKLSQKLRLDLGDEYGRPICYAFVYDRNSGLPKNYTWHCGCPGIPKPEWYQHQMFSIGGFSVDDPSEINFDNSNESYSNGLIVDFEIGCPVAAWMCSVGEEYWKSTSFGRLVAKTMTIGANAKLVQSILDSSNPNYYTLLRREALYGKRSHFNKLHDELITYLASEMYPENLDKCVGCKSALGFSKSQIIV